MGPVVESGLEEAEGHADVYPFVCGKDKLGGEVGEVREDGRVRKFYMMKA